MNKTNILKYWYDMEFFSPTNPVKNISTRYMNPKTGKINWYKLNDYIISYDIYLGEVQVDELIKEMIEKSGIKDVDDTIEKENAKSCVCGFKIDNDRRFVKGSFSISPFVYAVNKVIKNKSINIDFSEDEINSLNSQINSDLDSFLKNVIINENDLIDIYGFIINQIELDENLVQFSCVVTSKIVKKKSSVNDNKQNNKENNSDVNSENDNQDIKTDILESFYAKDLRWVLKKVSNKDKIYDYIDSMNNSSKDKIDIENDVEQLKEVLKPDNYPMGKWPSKYKPGLMQQVAINLSIKKDTKCFSVNGPPGTGKTTLIKEIIASNVVDRAFNMCQYNNPDDAFTKKKLENPFSIYSYYYELDKKLSDYGIMVASNNNKAVENITIELPKLKDMNDTMTNLFNLENEKELYFTDLAENLLDNKEKCWGLISARLGNKNNVNKFNDRIWYRDNSLRNRDEEVDWNKAKEDFINAYNEVKDYREYIKKAISDTEKYEKRKEYLGQKEKISKMLDEYEHEIEDLNNESKKYEKEFRVQSEKIFDIKNNMNYFQKLLSHIKTNNEIIEAENIKVELKNKIEELDQSIFELRMKQKELNEKEHVINEKIKECDKLKNKIKSYKISFEENYVNSDFWSNLKNNSNSQIVCPWTSNEYDVLREKLFYYAIKLQKAFVLNSNAVRFNLGFFVNIEGCNIKDKNAAYCHILNSLYLIVPVISTTFASVSNLLDGILSEQLGLLVIDEAGQASPSSAVGALCRFKKSVIVGDPLQIQPVLTVPKEISNILADKYNIQSEYRKRELSVQDLADNMNCYGGYRNKLWVGCPLNVHRRCISPMFDISNEIAYDGKMVNQTKMIDENEKCFLDKSQWIDIKGKEIGNKNHFVKEQGEAVLDIIEGAISVYEGLPEIFIISPFKTVIDELKVIVKQRLMSILPHYKTKIDDWIEESIGTVHTFQGKETKEVLFVLGCDETSRFAVNWAGRSVNMLNVAVTRAKYRIAIIGDKELWAGSWRGLLKQM